MSEEIREIDEGEAGEPVGVEDEPRGPDAHPRCAWARNDPLLARYHDEEWGRPIDDDDELFGRLMLEVFQAGLSWRTVLHKREALRRAFAGFDARRVAGFGEEDVARLLGDPGIIRNRAKIEATIANARACLEIRARYGSFRAFLDSLPADVATVTAELRKWFRFVGPVMVDSFLQAIGRIPPRHEPGCWLAAAGAAAVPEAGRHPGESPSGRS